jgi:hypothetical protein
VDLALRVPVDLHVSIAERRSARDPALLSAVVKTASDATPRRLSLLLRELQPDRRLEPPLERVEVRLLAVRVVDERDAHVREPVEDREHLARVAAEAGQVPNDDPLEAARLRVAE